MTRALFLAHTAAPSGAEIALHRLVTSMDKTEVTVVFTEPGEMVDRLLADGIDVEVLDSGFDSRSVTIGGKSVAKLIGGATGLLRLGWAVGALAREKGADIIVAESSKALLMGTVASRRARVPLVWHSHDRISREYFGAVFAAVLQVLGWIACSGFIANSRSTRDSLPTWRRPAAVAYPAAGRASDRQVLSRPAQREPQDAVLCLVARMTPWKGHALFLEAVAAMSARPAHVYLVGGTFFGEEAYLAELESLASRLDLPVTFTGHVDDPREYMLRSDVLVHTTLTAEPFGQVVVEGMLAGCAVVASRPGGIEEIVEHGVNGMLVDSGDQAGLTVMLDRVVADRELRIALAAAAPARGAFFDLDESARVVEDFLEQVLDRQKVGSRHAG